MIMEYLPLQVVKRGIFLIKNKGIFQKLLHINSVRGKVFCCRMAWWKQKDIFAVENRYTVDGRGIFSVQGEYPYIYVMTVQKIPGSVEAAGDKNGFQPRIKKEEFRENLLNQQIPHFDINENPICDRDIPAQFFYAVQGFLLHIKYPSGCSEKDLPLSGGNQLTALFSNRGVPSWRSSFLMCCVRAGWEIKQLLAAWEMFLYSATASRYS